MKIAVAGCAHGELEAIYNTIKEIQDSERFKIELLICCGDFQATRNLSDLRCMAVPVKYSSMGSFYKYYSGQELAPVLTIFIGGNHEASNYLQELEFGGWVAPNIYYMGYAGIVNIGGVRIGGISGIYKGNDYLKGHFEKSPYNDQTKRSVYHVRNLEVFRLKQVREPLDIMVSHDWPRGVYNYGPVEYLLKNKPFFRDEIRENRLGSQPCEELLYHLKPEYWFAAHLHTKFAAVIPHTNDGPEKKYTKFLALDKCLPGRDFLQVVDIPKKDNSVSETELYYDLEWLSILHTTNHLTSAARHEQYMPGPSSEGRWIFTPTQEEKSLILNRFGGCLKIPLNFVQTAPIYDENANKGRFMSTQPAATLNPQTSSLCSTLGIEHRMSEMMISTPGKRSGSLNCDTSFPSFLEDTVDDSSSCSSTSSGDAKEVSTATCKGKNESYEEASVIDTSVSTLGEGSSLYKTPERSFSSCFSNDYDLVNLDSTVSSSDSVSSANKRLRMMTLPSPKFNNNEDKISSTGIEAEDASLKIVNATTAQSDVGGTALQDQENSEQIGNASLPKQIKRRNRAVYDESED